MSTRDAMHKFKEQLHELKIDENVSDMSDEQAYFLYRIMDTVLDWLLNKYQHKIIRVMLHKYDIEVEEGYDPTQYYDDDNSSGNNEPPF